MGDKEEQKKMLQGQPDGRDAGEEQGVKMKKELGLMEGVAIILGIIIGSGERHQADGTFTLSFTAH